MASNFENVPSPNFPLLEQFDLELNLSNDLLTNRSSGTLISASVNNKNEATKMNSDCDEGNIFGNLKNSCMIKPLTKYSSSNNLAVIDFTDESSDRCDMFSKIFENTSNSIAGASAGAGAGAGPGASASIISGNKSHRNSAGKAKIVLICEPGSHPFHMRTIWLAPNTDCRVGRLLSKHRSSESNAIFDCKVLSRNHAMISFCSDEKFWLKDMNSSNGTFINDIKIEGEPSELHYGDIIRFGVDVIEHTKNELHGCIKAYVELYLPDGRPVASSTGAQISLSPHISGEGTISYNDLYQLSVYMQETSQRNESFEFELQNAQKLLDASRQETTDCWQTLLNKDQALQRIQLLEKKMQILEKNMTEQALQNEIKKLEEEKVAYQITAIETVQVVHSECHEVSQQLVKMESNLITSEKNYKTLREQIVNTEKSLQEASERLRQLELEHTNCRIKSEELKTKTQMEYEERSKELSEKVEKQKQQCMYLRLQLEEKMKTTNLGDGQHIVQSLDGNAKYFNTPNKIENENYRQNAEIIFQRPEAFDINKERSSMNIQTYYGKQRFQVADPVENLQRLEKYLKDLKNDIDENLIADGITNAAASNAIDGRETKISKLIKTYEAILESFLQLKDIAQGTSKLQAEALTYYADEYADNDCDGAKALQAQIKKLKAKLRQKDRDVKNTLDALVLKRDNYKEKVAELLKASENWRQDKEPQEQITTNKTKSLTKLNSIGEVEFVTVVGDANSDHVSCDSGVCVADKMTETTLKHFIDASSNTMDLEQNVNASDSINQEIHKELIMAKNKAAQTEGQIKQFKENLQTMDNTNDKLREEVLELKKRSARNNVGAGMHATVPIMVIIFAVLVYLAQNYL